MVSILLYNVHQFILVRSDPVPRRGDLVSIETYFQRDSRIAFERNWIIKNAATGQQLGVATRCRFRP